MKKTILALLFALVLCVVPALPTFAVDIPLLLDGADLLAESEEIALLAKLDRISETHKVEVIIAIEPNLGGMSPDNYVEQYYDFGDFGYGENRDGVLLLVSMEERDWRILSNGFGATAITEEEIDSIGEAVASLLGDEEYAEAFNLFVEECEYQINGEINGFPFAFGKNLIIALVIGLVVALIATGVMRRQLKSVRPQRTANTYVKSNSLKVTQASDLFLYRTVRRVERESSSSGSGRSGGSSRNVGGGKF